MAIYNKDGTAILSPYGIDGIAKAQAYDINGNTLLTPTIKLMAYNVGQWYLGNHDNVPANLDAEYYALQNGMIQSNDADILFLEEYTLQFSKTGRTALSMLQQYYPYIHERGSSNPSSSSGAYCCICSKYPISNYTHNTFSDGSGLYYDTCTITVNGIEIFVVITHLYWVVNGSATRTAEVQTLLNAVSGKPYFIIGGDFNTFDFFNTSSVDYTAVIKPFVDAGYNIANGGDFGFLHTYSDYTTMDDSLCLDNIVTSANIDILDAYTDTTKATDSIVEKIDHLPLIAIVKINLDE